MPRPWDIDNWDMPRRRGSRWIATLILAVVAFGLGTVTGGVVASRRVAINAQSPTRGQAPAGTRQAGALPPELNGNVVARIYQLARPSVVTITTVSGQGSANGPQEDVGTGFFIDDKGDIATNNHVVNGQSTVSVTVGTTTYTGKVVGTDPLDDLAIVHITPPSGMQPLPLGTASTLEPGDLVIAIGNPFELTASVSAGIVSGLNRSVPTDSGRLMSGLVQTDAALNPGNSGGPLLNEQGQVVGINTAIESPVQGSVGVGFAIPIDRLKRLLPQLLVGAKITHPWLGISAVDIDPAAQEQYHLPVSQGVLVISAIQGGPADKAGIRGDSGGKSNPKGDGDIITAIDGQPVADVASLTGVVSNHIVGDTVHLSVLRHGQRLDIPVVLAAWPDNQGS